MTSQTATTIDERYDRAKATLEQAGQAHILHFWDQLDEASRLQLLEQVEGVDWPEVTRLVRTHVLDKPEVKLPDRIDPAPWYPHVPDGKLASHYAQARALGEQLVRDGKVAAFTVAGGQGTRLGWDGPKGSFPATPIRGLPLFGCFAEYIHNVQRRYATTVPWYIMTSPANDTATRNFFHERNHFDLDPAHVWFFPQQMMPAIDMASGKVLLEAPDSIALSPNGHGGSLKALYTSGAVADMKQRGIEQISYIQVDNPLVRVVDPLFLGLHALDGAQMSSKMLPKRDPFEKLGNFCLIDGTLTVIEYSDLPEELAVQRDGEGNLRFLAGSIAIHALGVDFVEQLNTQGEGFSLPFHRAEKKVPHIRLEDGGRIEPVEPNAVKLETFVFDALPLTKNSIIYETSRGDEFAPIKNADGPGVEDSPSTSRDLQVRRAAAWLAHHGVEVPRREDGGVDALIEVSQRTAIYPEDLGAVELPPRIESGSEVLIDQPLEP